MSASSLSLQLKSCAKINFRLKVLSRLASGYHQIESIMQPIDLHDQITLQWEKGTTGRIRLECSDASLPKGSENLAVRAAEWMLAEAGPLPKGHLHIRLVKWIPVGSGLGGGSSNAAEVLKGLNQLLELHWSTDRLLELGARLGMDVPFFIRSLPALATDRGETILPYPEFPETHLVLLLPDFGVSTAWAYQALDATLTRKKRTAKLPALFQDSRELLQWMRNDLQAPVAAKHPVIEAMVQSLKDSGALAAQVSGSGSAVFGLYADRDSAQRASQMVRPPRGCRAVLARGLPAAESGAALARARAAEERDWGVAKR